LQQKEQWSASYFLKRITQSFTNVLQMKLERHSITNTQVVVLFCLSSEDGQSQNELSKYFNIKAPTLTAILDQLERKGLIERRPDSQDGRKKRIYLSQSGTQFLKEKMFPIFNELEGNLLFGFSEEERNLFLSLLVRLHQNINMETVSIKRGL
jgi:DNA-binding MarR family transcriptional regulator